MPDWWECDVLRVSKAGYWCEYEIKSTRADFRNDRKKQHKARSVWNVETNKYERQGERNKHDLLQNDPTTGPARFFFVTPEDMLEEEDIPKWAGWIEVRLKTGRRPVIHVRKQGPLRHKNKADEEFHRVVLNSAYNRFVREHAQIKDKVLPTHVINNLSQLAIQYEYEKDVQGMYGRGEKRAKALELEEYCKKISKELEDLVYNKAIP